MIKKTVSLLAVAVLAVPTVVEAAVLSISWTGSGNYSMTGQFSYDDSLIGTGPITSSALQSFRIDGFLGAAPVGTFDLFADAPLLGTDTFNFNFDTTSETFLVGGFSAGPNGQDWATAVGGVGCSTTGFGFSSGSGGQGLCINNSLVGFISVSQSTLTATRQAVPEPASLALLGIGLAGLAASRRRKQ